MNRLSFRAWLGIWLALLFFGALFWAKGRDPFQRIWFSVKTPDYGKAECIAVLPKTAAKPLPVVLYIHGSGGRLLASGNELRQMAEMGLATIGMEYNQTNEAAFAEQFTALREHVFRQPWADTNRVAWVGFSLGANRSLAYALKHPESQPQLLVCVSGGWVPEIEKSETRNQKSEIRLSSALLIHGEQDFVFSMADARRLAAALQTNGFQVDLKTFPGQSHGFDPNRRVLFRAVGEYALKFFRGEQAFQEYQSILVWQAQAKPLWLFWIPAAGWVVAWGYARRKVGRGTPCAPAPDVSKPGAHGVTRPTIAGEGKHSRWEIGLRWAAAILGTLAIGVTALHLIPPQMEITPRTLELARKHLVQPKEISDFDGLRTNSFWSGKKLKTLLEHVELANYNRELVNWKLDEELYRRFVLTPEISPLFDGSRHWRRWLWESFYPRIRKENSLEAAAEIIVRHLRERVTIVGNPLTPALSPSDGARETGKLPHDIEQVWIRQITNEKGFAAIHVAALRSAGVPARLNPAGRAEFWTGSEWKPAPQPLLGTW